jgi:hypothetical protein
MSEMPLTGRESVTERLIGKFPDLPATTVERCVAEWRLCCGHLGIAPDSATVAELAAARLAGMTAGCPHAPRSGSAPASAPASATAEALPVPRSSVAPGLVRHGAAGKALT